MKMGSGAEPASLWLGVVFLALTLVGTALLGRRLFGSWEFALVAPFLLVCQGPMILWSVSGLETSCFTAISVLAFLAYERGFVSTHGLFGAGVLYALSTTVRLDGVVYGAAAGTHLMLCGLLPRSVGRVGLAQRTGALVAGFLILFTPFMLWRHHYYGDWLPNVFYVKVSGQANLTLGWNYLASWFGEYPLAGGAALAGLLATLTLPQWRSQRRTFVHLLLALTLFSAYLVWVGGDYMALYRFVVPMLPLAMLLAAALVRTVFDAATRLRVPGAAVGVVGLAALGVVARQLWLPTQRSLQGTQIVPAVATVQGMASNTRQWALVGKSLREWKDKLPRNFTIATTAAGALPFFSEMRTIDQSGLCDRYTAKLSSDPWILDRPGHMKQATRQHLEESRPDLIFGHPRVETCGKPPGEFPVPPTPDYALRAMPVPHLAKDGKCAYVWVRKDDLTDGQGHPGLLAQFDLVATPESISSRASP